MMPFSLLAINGSIQIIHEDEISALNFPFTNRSNTQPGDRITLSYAVTFVNAVPTAQWLKDGIPVMRTEITERSGDEVLALLHFTFAESDAGVYQCVFTDTTRSEVFVTDPIRLDTGEDSPIHTNNTAKLCLTCCCRGKSGHRGSHSLCYPGPSREASVGDQNHWEIFLHSMV